MIEGKLFKVKGGGKFFLDFGEFTYFGVVFLMIGEAFSKRVGEFFQDFVRISPPVLVGFFERRRSMKIGTDLQWPALVSNKE